MSLDGPRRKRSLRPSWLSKVVTVTVLLVLLPQVTASIFSDQLPSYCKCICFSNSTIIPLYLPADPSKPCLTCTRQFCLDQKLAICRDAEVPELDTDVGTGTEGDVEARCFKRDSPRDQLIVTFFLLVVIGLLLYAAIRSRLQRAIEARGRPKDMRQWSEALLPDNLHPFSNSIFDHVPGRSRNRGLFRGAEMRDAGTGQGYAPLSVGS